MGYQFFLDAVKHKFFKPHNGDNVQYKRLIQLLFIITPLTCCLPLSSIDRIDWEHTPSEPSESQTENQSNNPSNNDSTDSIEPGPSNTTCDKYWSCCERIPESDPNYDAYMESCESNYEYGSQNVCLSAFCNLASGMDDEWCTQEACALGCALDGC